MTTTGFSDQIKVVTCHPVAFREYVLLPDKVVKRLLPAGDNEETHALHWSLRCSLDEAIQNDQKLAAERDQLLERGRLASLIVHNPRLRADYLQNPSRVLAWAEPRQGLLERISPMASRETRARRATLGDAIELMISHDPRLISAREATFEKNVFLREALRNPERTFAAIAALSIAAFATGIGLIVGAFLAAIYGDGTIEKALLGGLSGAGGAATTLSAIVVLSVGLIRRANAENAQLRLILTDFATELTHYRAISIRTAQDAQERNEAIHQLTEGAVREIQQSTEPGVAAEARTL